MKNGISLMKDSSLRFAALRRTNPSVLRICHAER